MPAMMTPPDSSGVGVAGFRCKLVFDRKGAAAVLACEPLSLVPAAESVLV